MIEENGLGPILACAPDPSLVYQERAVDDVSADAIMVDGDISMTMRFTFDRVGLIEAVRAEARGAIVDGNVVMMPWEGRMSNRRAQALLARHDSVDRIRVCGAAVGLADIPACRSRP